MRRWRFAVASRAIAAMATLAALSCGGDGPSASPAAPSTSAAGHAPARKASAVAAVPTPPPGSVPSACRLGLGDPNAACGQSGPPSHVARVDAAIDQLVHQQPWLFDFGDVSAPDTSLYKVLDVDGYLDGVVRNLVQKGACAQRDPGDVYHERILVKTGQDYSEAYDVLTSSGYIRRGEGAHVDSCRPAAFPITRGPDVPPASSGCGKPYPPPISRFNCKVHLKGVEFDTLDSTPLVGPDVEYCAAIGYTDGRSFCPVRQDGAPDRYACEIWRVGTADDTGYPGPTWTGNAGGYCTGPASGCQIVPGNPFQLWAYVSGSYKVEADGGASCTVRVDQ